MKPRPRHFVQNPGQIGAGIIDQAHRMAAEHRAFKPHVKGCIGDDFEPIQPRRQSFIDVKIHRQPKPIRHREHVANTLAPMRVGQQKRSQSATCCGHIASDPFRPIRVGHLINAGQGRKPHHDVCARLGRQVRDNLPSQWGHVGVAPIDMGPDQPASSGDQLIEPPLCAGAKIRFGPPRLVRGLRGQSGG